MLIVGAGAVGLGLGSCLARAGHPLCFLVRSGSTPHPLEQHGLTRTGLFGNVRVAPEQIEVLHEPRALRGRRFESILVCTKTTATDAIAASLAEVWPSLPGPPRVVLCQNGWGNAERFALRLPEESVFNALVITGFRRGRPHEVEITVHADAIRVGSLFGSDASALQPLCEAIGRGGIPCELSSEIARDLWAKLLYNCLLNPLGALTGVRYGVLAERAHTRAVMEQLAREIFAVMERAEQRTRWRDADAYLEVFHRELLPPTASHESSMLQDLRAGRPTEIDALCGAVAALAAELGVDTPLCRALTTLVHAAER